MKIAPLFLFVTFSDELKIFLKKKKDEQNYYKKF